MKAVLVTTKYRGVFFGYVSPGDMDDLPQQCVLRRAQNCVWWDTSVHGFLGLTNDGPDDQCRIGPPAEMLTLYDITAWAKVTDKAAKRWEAQPWKYQQLSHGA